jgi:hypothetical protein
VDCFWAAKVIKVAFKRPPGWNQLGRKELAQLKGLVLSDLVAGLRGVQDAIMLTPVYTGKTLVNYRWSVGEAVRGTRPAVKEPDLPGKTSGMALGREPRRSANAAVVREEFEAVLATLRTTRNPFQNIYLTNSTPYFDQVEYGTYSTSEGSKARTPPGGMTRRGETVLEATILGLTRVSSSV